MNSLEGKRAIITGGNTGIGRAVALALADAGADVALTSYSSTSDDTVDAIEALGRRAFRQTLDATDSAQVNTIIPQLVEQLGGLDILMTNAGHLVGRMALADMDDAHWHKVIDVNLSSTFYCVRAAMPYLSTGGRIVTMSSLAAHTGGGAGAAAYSAAKAGLLGLTRGLAKELASRRITVNAVAPGLILGTAFHDTFSGDEGKRAAIAGIPLGRGGTPEEVAAAVLYLVSEGAAFVTGEVIEINGGAWFN